MNLNPTSIPATAQALAKNPGPAFRAAEPRRLTPAWALMVPGAVFLIVFLPAVASALLALVVVLFVLAGVACALRGLAA